MKYIISQADLADLKAKIQSWLSANCRNPYYYKTKKRITAYLNLCTYFYIEETTLTKLIKKYFKNATKTFYRWAQKIMTAYYSDNLDLLLFKTTKPQNLNYQYSLNSREKVCDLYFDYKNLQAGGMWSLFNNLKIGFHDVKNSEVPKNIKTFYRWIKSDPRWKELKQQIKQTKRHFKRYEVSEIGLLQMDAKIITTSNFPVDKKYYIYDFIDEITRIVFGYVYDSLGTNNAINAVQRAMKDFSELGITIKRLRTDNAPEFTTTNWSNKKAYKVKERPFTTFLSKSGIVHETTPIRSPQSNGKIERFHQHYNKLFYSKDKKLNQNELQHYLNKYYYFYNFERCHSSLNTKTPFQTLQKFLRK
ncbi:integrase core domain-containing protein [Spiroplasma endosymbiont of Clivina fossor]|uniref:integrase core domain-containing protein n=1 Tax=Spiroplasma endosymbiont of Clivina fossor TaxID=3066282 RepID=UPI00313E6B50